MPPRGRVVMVTSTRVMNSSNKARCVLHYCLFYKSSRDLTFFPKTKNPQLTVIRLNSQHPSTFHTPALKSLFRLFSSLPLPGPLCCTQQPTHLPTHSCTGRTNPENRAQVKRPKRTPRGYLLEQDHTLYTLFPSSWII